MVKLSRTNFQITTGWWFSLGTPVFSSNKNVHHDIAEILLKVVLNTIFLNLTKYILNGTAII
jgi:hypothetical protein